MCLSWVVDKSICEEELASVRAREKEAAGKHDQKMKGALPLFMSYTQKLIVLPTAA